MTVLVIADVHSNLTALRAVLRAAGKFGEVWCLGDVVGYGPEPNECIELLSGLPLRAVVGNHDLGSLGGLPPQAFNPAARLALQWTAELLTGESVEFLRTLPRTAEVGPALLAHGSPREPVWEYLFASSQAESSFEIFSQRLCLVGHTHIPTVFRKEGDEVSDQVPWEPALLEFGEGVRYILNPGSVGQPRDGDPRASYALFDPEAGRIEHRRVAYDIALTQGKMAKAGLPQPLIDRLAWGL